MMKFTFRVIFTRPPFSKWLPTKSSNWQWSDFNENWYLGVFWNEELVGALNSDMGVVWELLCLHPSTIKPSYYYYSSSSSHCDFVRPNSRRLMIRSLLNFTGTWISISRGAFKFWNFQNGHYFKMATNIKIKKIAKDFNGNGYLQEVRLAAPYGDHFGLLWRPFWIQNGRQNTNILRFWRNLVSK